MRWMSVVPCCKRLRSIFAIWISCVSIGAIVVYDKSMLNLTQLPSPGPPPDATKVLLNDNFLTSIPDYAFENNTELNNLVLSTNQLEIIGDYAFVNTVLDTLKAHTNLLTAVPNLTSVSSTLEILDLHMNRISDVQNLRPLTELSKLHLGTNAITSLPGEIAGFTSLSNLILQNNALNTLLDLSGLTATLTVLDLDNNNISCDTHLCWIRFLNVTVISVEGICFSPPKYSGVIIREISWDEICQGKWLLLYHDKNL